ncbi:hypothetical protein [Mesorhizobium sp. INR15]|uniref:hypothetical protein n=1 Tax=Mesorhizobium sp. INR15 TaxID=2654248 RepID=UPI0018969FAD|nr:hypothetical protein [Mesorhizobium sp. INR15]QPC90005.1 hypothetical protein GA829_05040 [Mesorhizobium sp. INR15]
MMAKNGARTLMQRALTDLPRGPEDIVELFGPAHVRDITIQILQGVGCKLDGDTMSVELLIQYARQVDVEPRLRQWRRSFERPHRGRPPTDLFDATIYAAARNRFRHVKNGAAAAAEWLGLPATKDRVEKGDKLFRRLMPRAYAGVGLTRDVALLSAARIIIDITKDLEALAEKMSQERAAASRAKRTGRHAAFSAQMSTAK